MSFQSFALCRLLGLQAGLKGGHFRARKPKAREAGNQSPNKAGF
jgi:hypothetical protein